MIQSQSHKHLNEPADLQMYEIYMRYISESSQSQSSSSATCERAQPKLVVL